jgi:soluble lytic murein transglycosylase
MPGRHGETETSRRKFLWWLSPPCGLCASVLPWWVFARSRRQQGRARHRPGALAPVALFFGLAAVGFVFGVVAGRPPGEGAWRDEVNRWCAEYNVNPDLVLAVIDVESSGRPRAVSPAGAVGLMQLMPETAAEVARTLSLAPPTAEDILEPRLNIRLGVCYLARLRTRFGDERAFVIAAYHAGPTSVERWRQARQSISAERVIEEEAGPATRSYVARVIGRWKAIAASRALEAAQAATRCLSLD